MEKSGRVALSGVVLGDMDTSQGFKKELGEFRSISVRCEMVT